MCSPGTPSGWCLQYARPRGDRQQERPSRRRPALRAAAPRRAEAGVPRCEGAADAEGAREELRRSGQRCHARDAAHQGVVPCPRDRAARHVGLPGVEAKRMAGAARGARCTNESLGATHRAGCTAATAAEGKGGDDHGSPATAWLEDLRSIPFLGPVRVAQILAITANAVAAPCRTTSSRRPWPQVA